MRFWSEAKNLNERHFDSTCNYVMYRWSTGRITDSEMMIELSEFIFDVSHKGQCLEAYLNLAVGNLDKGYQILNDYITSTRKDLLTTRTKNVKV